MMKGKEQSYKAFESLFKEFFHGDDEDGYSCSPKLEALAKTKIKISHWSSILNGSGKTANISFDRLFREYFLSNGKNVYTPSLKLKAIIDSDMILHFSSMLHSSGSHSCSAFLKLFKLLFVGNDEEGYSPSIKLQNLIDANMVSYFSHMINGSREKASIDFLDLFNVLFVGNDEEGYSPSIRLKTIKDAEITIIKKDFDKTAKGMSLIEGFNYVFKKFFDGNDEDGYRPSFFCIIHSSNEKHNVNFYKLYNLLFVGEDKACFPSLKLKAIIDSDMIFHFSSILHSLDEQTIIDFYELFNLFFVGNDEEGYSPSIKLRAVLDSGINTSIIYDNKSGKTVYQTFNDKFKEFFDGNDKDGYSLKKEIVIPAWLKNSPIIPELPGFQYPYPVLEESQSIFIAQEESSLMLNFVKSQDSFWDN